MSEPLDVLVCYVPAEHTQAVLAGLFAAGAGSVGEYEECAFVSQGTGQFRPVGAANPAIGTVGELEFVAEHRVELTFPRSRRAAVVEALRRVHPYEEPAFHVLRNEADQEAGS